MVTPVPPPPKNVEAENPVPAKAAPPAKCPAPAEPAPPVTHTLEKPDSDWMLRTAKGLVKFLRKLNTGSQPPEHWEITWVNGLAPILTDIKARNPAKEWAIVDVTALDVTKYPTKYTTPALIMADLSRLETEIDQMQGGDGAEWLTLWDKFVAIRSDHD